MLMGMKDKRIRKAMSTIFRTKESCLLRLFRVPFSFDFLLFVRPWCIVFNVI